jgi:uncharacterized protein (DUF885 family)
MSNDIAALADEYWQHELRINPTTALLMGDHRFDAEIEDLSREAEDDAIAAYENFAGRAKAIDPAGLSKEERVTRGVLLHEARAKAEELKSRMAEFDVNPSMGIHVVLPQIVGQIRLPGSSSAEAIVRKWGLIEGALEQAVYRLRQGVALNRTPPQVAVEKSIAQIDAYLASPIDSDPFIGVVPPESFTPDEVEDWRDRLKAQVVASIRPGYERYRTALVDEVLPKARPQEKTGLRWLPDGEEVYDRAILRHTTMHMTAHEVHEIGLEVVDRLADEYRFMGARTLGLTDLAQIYHQLRNDSDLRFNTAEEIVAAAENAMNRAREAIPKWFGRLPQAACVMAEVPELGADEAPLAFYSPPATDGSRPGTYFINTTSPTPRTRYESEALAFHEAIPGHHLQIAIAQELDSVPEFQKHALVTAHVEGWGLYTERLCDEMGLYSNDVARIGMLSFDSWRACRLVVDTGMHALGWSRREAIDYMTANSPQAHNNIESEVDRYIMTANSHQAHNNIESEVDRYIGWPGQALAYMIGRREIMRLRSMAQQEMGSSFDIKGFHDAVLGSGAVPLPVLAELVVDYTMTG